MENSISNYRDFSKEYFAKLILLYIDFLKFDPYWSTGLENEIFMETLCKINDNKIKISNNFIKIIENSHKILEKKYINSLANLELLNDYTNYLYGYFYKRIEDNITQKADEIYNNIVAKKKTEQEYLKQYAIKRKFKKFEKERNNPYIMTESEFKMKNSKKFLPHNLHEFISLQQLTNNLLHTNKFWQYYVKIPDFYYPFLPPDHYAQQYSYFKATGVGANLVKFVSVYDNYDYVLDNVSIPWHSQIVYKNIFLFTPYVLTNIIDYCLKYHNDPLIYTPEYLRLKDATFPVDFGDKFIYPFKEKGTSEPIGMTISSSDYIKEIKKYNMPGYNFLKNFYSQFPNELHIDIFQRAYSHQFDSTLLLNDINLYDPAFYTQFEDDKKILSYRF